MKTPFWLTVAFATLTVSSFAQAPPSTATIIESNKVAAAFAKGRPLVENSQFKVHASRREAPGVVEIHTRDTDIIYVLEGSATFVTGGTAVEPKTVAPDEIRGKEIQGGETRRVSKGDVIIVPNGVPHWFRQVEAPLLYYVVKVTTVK
jgi:glc operon protein GlcG